MRLSTSSLLERFASHTPEATYPRPVDIRALASVALIACHADIEEESHLCMIKRTTREGDRWSGHMAFPGGRASPEDVDALDTARRETQEEVGLDLRSCATHVGELDQILLQDHGDAREGVLHAHAFSIEAHTLPLLIPEEREVAQAYWVPLSALLDVSSASAHAFVYEEESMRFPALDYGEHTIWGLTYRLLLRFAQVADLSVPVLDEFASPKL